MYNQDLTSTYPLYQHKVHILSVQHTSLIDGIFMKIDKVYGSRKFHLLNKNLLKDTLVYIVILQSRQLLDTDINKNSNKSCHDSNKKHNDPS